MAGLNIYDNGQMKTIDFSPWGGIDGFLSASAGADAGDIHRLRMIVPWLNKAIGMTGNATAQLPYRIEDAADNEIDDDIAWGGVKNPRTLINLVASSLCGGAAYLLADVTPRAIVNLQYVTPNSMSPTFNSAGELINFKRTVSGSTKILLPEQVIYFWLPDDSTETGAAINTPNANAVLSAGVLAAQDYALKQYGERGFVPPMLVSVKGMPNKTEAEKTEKWLNLWLRGITRTITKLINADTMSLQAAGAGMAEMKGAYGEITSWMIKNIAASYGIPNSTFLSDENSYATAQSDIRLWYSSSVFVKIHQTIEDTFTDQLFYKFGWSMEFEPEKIEAFQQDEVDKSGALSTLASAFATSPEAAIIAADVLGYDLSDEQIAAIEELTAQPEPAQPESILPQASAGASMPTNEENLIAESLMKWRKFERHAHANPYDDKTKSIPPALYLQISTGLKSASNQDEIDLVFDAAAKELPVIRLARAIENA